ncbi:hypothetical protein N431DRAFT_463087 [Stipitochalara longipes BDJ]|nr:hypothetical protein N431DRAFT_463087 [Stipitochalara longipes BDJ]
MLHSKKLILVLFNFIGGLAADGWDGAILTYDGYVHLRTCAQACIAGGSNADQPGILIGCPNPVYDSCFCRGMEDLAAPVTSLISSCVNSRCSSDQTDVTAAFAVYNGYCSQAGYPHAAVNTAATTTAGGASVAATGIPTSTVLAITTVTGSAGMTSATTLNIMTTQASSMPAGFVTIHSTTTEPAAQGTGSASNSAGDGGLGQSNKIALGVGLGLGIPSLIVAIASCLGCGRRGRERLRALTGSAYS